MTLLVQISYKVTAQFYQELTNQKLEEEKHNQKNAQRHVEQIHKIQTKLDERESQLERKKEFERKKAALLGTSHSTTTLTSKHKRK